MTCALKGLARASEWGNDDDERVRCIAWVRHHVLPLVAGAGMKRCYIGLIFISFLVGCRESPSSGKPSERALASAIPTASHSVAPVESVRAIDPPAGPGSEAPNLFATSKGVLLSWAEIENNKKSIRWARFFQNRWSEPSTVVTSDELLVNWSDVPAIAEANGRIIVAFPEFRPKSEGYQAAWVSSVDGGKTFTRRGTLHSDTSQGEHGFVAFAPADKDSVRAFWLDGRATLPNNPAPAMRLYSALVGDLVSDEVLLDERTCDCCSLGVGHSDAGAIVAYRDRNEQEVRDISVVRSEGNGFSKPLLVHDDGYRIAGCPVNGPAVAVEGSRVAVAWYTYAGEQAQVKVAFSSDLGARFSAPITVADSQAAIAPLGRVAVAWGDQGDALVTYLASERERARILVRRVHPSGSVFAPFAISGTRPERKSGFPKMVRLDDRLFVVWTDGASASRVHAATVALNVIARQTDGGSGSYAADARVVKEGDSFPVFDVRTLEGKTISSASLNGKPRLVNLWASYCEPCRQEIPNLTKIHQKYQKRGLQVVGISMDERLTGDALAQLAKRRDIDYAVWQDPDDHAGQALGVRVLPVTFLIDAAGKVILVRRGAVRDDDVELEKAITSLF